MTQFAAYRGESASLDWQLANRVMEIVHWSPSCAVVSFVSNPHASASKHFINSLHPFELCGGCCILGSPCVLLPYTQRGRSGTWQRSNIILALASPLHNSMHPFKFRHDCVLFHHLPHRRHCQLACHSLRHHRPFCVTPCCFICRSTLVSEWNVAAFSGHLCACFPVSIWNCTPRCAAPGDGALLLIHLMKIH